MALWQYELSFGVTGSERGWRELIIWLGSGTSPFDDQNDWIARRQTFLSGGAYIFAWTRRRIDQVVKSSQTIKVPKAFGGVDLPLNVSGDCIDYNAYSAGGVNRRVFTFRGIPDDWVTNDDLTSLGVAGKTIIEAYLAWIVASSGAIRIPDTAFPYSPIIIAANVGTGTFKDIQITTTTGAAIDVDTGDDVVLKGLHNYPYLNGNWKAGKVDSSNFTLRGSSRYVVSLTDTGEWRLFSPAAAGIVSVGYSQAATRQTGKRPFLPRGKASARVLHR